MKKKFLTLTLCVCMAFSMVACSKKEDTSETAATSNTGVNTSPEGELKLAEYKGYEVAESVTVVKDSEVESYIDSVLAMFSTEEKVTEGVLEEGMKIEIKYTETIDGKASNSGEASTLQLELNPDKFVVDGFVQGLIGKSVGETVEMDLTFPEDYTDASLANKPVHYSVEITSIVKTIVPEYNDEFVSKNYSFAGFKTAEEFTKFIEQEVYYIQINNSIWEDIVDKQEVVSYPAEELSQYVDRSFAQIEQMVTAYGHDMNSYYTQAGTTEEKLKAELEGDCKVLVKEKMFVRAVAEKEGIEYSEEAAAKFAAISGYTSIEEFEKYLDELGEELEYSVLSYLVQNFICDSAKIVPQTEVETTTAAQK